ncbi:MAG TPA: hypothetical protein VM183_12750 [Burkholderiales bacterium]|nr:hypothetical protein [Burkholderiales bacterium]
MTVLPALVVIASVLITGTAQAQERPPLKGASAVRISNYGAPSRLISTPHEVSAIMGELEGLRGKRWRQADLKMRCYATVQVMHGEKTVTVFRVRPEYVLERAQDKAVPTYNLQVVETDLPQLRKLLSESPPSKSCE